MDYSVLASELRSDPLGRGYATMTVDEAVASLNASNRTEIYSRRVDERDVVREWPAGAASSDSFLRKVEAIAAAEPNTYLARVINWLRPSEGGINAGDARTRASLDTLVGVGGITAEEVAMMKALAERIVSRAAELGLGIVTRGDVLRYKQE